MVKIGTHLSILFNIEEADLLLEILKDYKEKVPESGDREKKYHKFIDMVLNGVEKEKK